jgi:hypothetical protein
VVVANKCDLEYERQVQPHGGSNSASALDLWTCRLVERRSAGVEQEATLRLL